MPGMRSSPSLLFLQTRNETTGSDRVPGMPPTAADDIHIPAIILKARGRGGSMSSRYFHQICDLNSRLIRFIMSSQNEVQIKPEAQNIEIQFLIHQ